MTQELEELFESLFRLRKLLEQVLPKEAIDYILTLVVKDKAHRRFLELEIDSVEPVQELESTSDA